MTLSNKILILFFGTILVYTLMAFVEIRISGETRVFDHENSITETVTLASIKYLVIDEEVNHRISMSSSDNPRLEMKSKSGDVLSKLNYSLKNDTLFINNMEEVEYHFDIAIYIPKNGFNGLRTSSNRILLTDIQQQSLSITQNSGRVDLDRNIDLERLNIISSTDATLEITNAKVDTVALKADDSTLHLYGKVHRIEGTLENSTRLYASDVAEIQLKKDKGSSIRIMD